MQHLGGENTLSALVPEYVNVCHSLRVTHEGSQSLVVCLSFLSFFFFIFTFLFFIVILNLSPCSLVNNTRIACFMFALAVYDCLFVPIKLTLIEVELLERQRARERERER